MKILQLEDGNGQTRVIVRAVLGGQEFEHLGGALDNLCVFSTKAITEPSSAIMTGAKHSHAKYLLFPASLRRHLKSDDLEFERISCGTVDYKDSVYVVFSVPRKIPAAPSEPHSGTGNAF